MLSLVLFGPDHWMQIANAAFFSLLGMILFIGAFVAIDKATPYHLWREIVQEKNVALSIVVAAMSLAMGIVIAAAIH